MTPVAQTNKSLKLFEEEQKYIAPGLQTIALA